MSIVVETRQACGYKRICIHQRTPEGQKIALPFWRKFGTAGIVRRPLKLGLGLVAATLGVILLLGGSSGPRHELERTRQLLRQQGFKTELSQFALTPPPEVRLRAAVLARTTRAEVTNRNLTRPALSLPNAPRFITPVSANAALVVWRPEAVAALEAYRYPYRELWSETRESVRTNQAVLASIRQAALGGEIRFGPIGHPGPQALLPYLADL